MKLGSSQRTMKSRLMRLTMAGGLTFGFIGGAFPACDEEVQQVFVDGMEQATLFVIQGQIEDGVEQAAIAVVESLFQSVRPSADLDTPAGAEPAI
jgi:hypothetical protein